MTPALILVAIVAQIPTGGFLVTGLPLTGPAAEEFLLTAEIVTVEDLDCKGVTRPHRVTLSHGVITARAAFKDIDVYAPVKKVGRGERQIRFRDSYHHEIAAWKLDELLGLGIVPPCVERSIRGHRGALCLWVEGAITEWERLKVRRLSPPDAEAWNNQMCTIRLFLQLIADTDFQNISNLLVDQDFRIYKIDSSRAFRDSGTLPRPGELTRFSRSVLDALRRMDPAEAAARLQGCLDEAQVKGVMLRRDAILRLADQRIAERGEIAVLFP